MRRRPGFLPTEWTNDAARCNAADAPANRLVYRTKLEIALPELDRLVAAGGSVGCVLTDAELCNSASFRQALSLRGLRRLVAFRASGRSTPPTRLPRCRRPSCEWAARSGTRSPRSRVRRPRRCSRACAGAGSRGAPAPKACSRPVSQRYGSSKQTARRTPAASARRARRRGSRASVANRANRSATSRATPWGFAPRHRGGDSGALKLRAGASAAQGGVGPRPIHGTHLARTSPRAADADQIRRASAPLTAARRSATGFRRSADDSPSHHTSDIGGNAARAARNPRAPEWAASAGVSPPRPLCGDNSQRDARRLSPPQRCCAVARRMLKRWSAAAGAVACRALARITGERGKRMLWRYTCATARPSSPPRSG